MKHRIPTIFIVLLVGLLSVSYAKAEQFTLRTLGDVPQVKIGSSAKSYFAVSNTPVIIPVQGPGTISGYARIPLESGAENSVAGTLHYLGIPGPTVDLPFEFKPSRRSTYTEPGRDGVPSSGRKVKILVPAGTFNLQFTATTANSQPMLLVLYFDGPSQPDLPGLTAINSTKKTARKKKGKGWSFKNAAGIDFLYNDNILSNGPAYMEDFITGSYPWKFKTESNDDLVIATSLDLEARKKLLSWGQSRFRFKVKRFTYTHNPIKTNIDFHFYVRQFFGKTKSLELYAHFSPEQFIRMLSDRPPYGNFDIPIQWQEFRFQRNVWNVTWRQKMTKKITGKFLFEKNYRYYNQAFMENDIEAWEVRGNIAYKFNKTFRLNLDYSYENATGRGRDTAAETPETSNNGDSSYERDLYRIGLTIKPSFTRKFVQVFDASFLFMDYYYTTQRPLAEDPFHVGRNDRYYKTTLSLSRKISKPLTLKAAVRRTERVVYSPWDGDITIDKDFTQWMYWINMTYRF